MSSKRLIYLTGCNGQIGCSIASTLKNNNCYTIGIDLAKDSTNRFIDDYYSGSITDTVFVSLFNSVPTNLDLSLGVSLVNNAGVTVFTFAKSVLMMSINPF